MKQDFQAGVVAVCKDLKKQNSQNDDYRACVYIGAKYFVRYGIPKDLEPERATQEFYFNHAKRPQTPVPPQSYHFVEERTMYLVVERITLQESPPDIARIQEAIEWLSGVPLPSNPMGLSISWTLECWMRIWKAYGLLSVAARQNVPPVSVSGERLMFTQSDMDVSNFVS